ncbi:ankyrin repeat and KH domain-containing protein 1-like protein [Turdus rufiventris]|nr:ankyrin repeat and KH domain-containing protein 1-like protein [Turdus rufiventris]
MLTDGTAAAAADEEIDSVAPRAPPAAAEPPAAAGPSPLGLRAVRLFGEAGPGGPGGPGAPAAGEAALDFKLAAAVLRSGGGGGSGSDEDEVSEVKRVCPIYPGLQNWEKIETFWFPSSMPACGRDQALGWETKDWSGSCTDELY